MVSTRKLTQAEFESYSHISKDLTSLVRIVNTNFKIPGFAGLTLGRFIFVGKHTPKDGTSALIAHELVHVRQWFELGTFGFIANYLGDFAKNLIRTRGWKQAYRNIELEKQARAQCSHWSCN